MTIWYVVAFQECDSCEKEPNDGQAVRLREDIVDRAGGYKYVTMVCDSCGAIESFKRSCWWDLVNLTDTIFDVFDGEEKLIQDLPDYTERIRQWWVPHRKVDDFSVHGG